MSDNNPSSESDPSDLSPPPCPIVLGKKRQILSSSSSSASGDALNQASDMGEEEEEVPDKVPKWYRMLWECIYNDPRNAGLSYEEMELVFARVLKRTKLPLYDEDEPRPMTEKKEDKTIGVSGDDADVSLNNSEIQLGSEDSISGSGLSLNVPLTPRAFEEQISPLNSSNSSSDVEMESEII